MDVGRRGGVGEGRKGGAIKSKQKPRVTAIVREEKSEGKDHEAVASRSRERQVSTIDESPKTHLPLTVNDHLPFQGQNRKKHEPLLAYLSYGMKKLESIWIYLHDGQDLGRGERRNKSRAHRETSFATVGLSDVTVLTR